MAAHALKCGSCGNEIDSCAFCGEADCPSAQCNNCLALALKQRVPQPHLHGG